MMRCCSWNSLCCSATGAIARLGLPVSVIAMGVSIAPSGSRTPSLPCQPPRWKSVMRIASRLGSADSLRMLPASLSAGPYRVAPAPGCTPLTAASSRPLSAADRSATSVDVEKKTSDARSDDDNPLIAFCAAPIALAHLSP